MEFEKIYLRSLKNEKSKINSRSNYKKNLAIKKPYLLWRKEKCEICGTSEDQRILHIHHLNPLLKGTNKDNPFNCVTLCFNHHALAEYGKYPKWKNRLEFEKWLLKYKNTKVLKKIVDK